MNNFEIQVELKKYLLSSNVAEVIKENETKIFFLIPELRFEKGFDQKSKWHCYDVWDHTIHAIKSSHPNFDIRMVLLLHDIGKPFSYQDDGDIRHFKGHADKSAEISKKVLNRLGFSLEEIEYYCFFISHHATTITEETLNDENIDKYKKLLHIQHCDASAYAPEYAKQIICKLDVTKKMVENYGKK